jgi:hypothetical protein
VWTTLAGLARETSHIRLGSLAGNFELLASGVLPQLAAL